MSASNEEIHRDTDGHGAAPESRWLEAADDAGYHGARYPETADHDDRGADHDAADHGDGRYHSDARYHGGAGYPEPPRTEPGPQQPGVPWRRSRNRMEFSGDAAAAQLRKRLSMAPDRIAEPPPSERAPSSFGGWPITGAAAVVVLGVGGYLWAHGSNTAAASRDITPASAAATAAPRDYPVGPEPPQYAPASYEAGASPLPTRTRSLSLPMHAVPDTAAAMSALSPGPAPARAPAPPPLRRANTEEIALMMKQGQKFMENADISGARLVFQRAAEAGEPAAALALAETYDPVVLGATASKAGLIPNATTARDWYERAKELGSPVASDRIARLDEIER
jgi:hypothetical protein